MRGLYNMRKTTRLTLKDVNLLKLNSYIKILAIYLISCSVLHNKADNITMYSLVFSGLTNKDGSGYYWDIVLSIFIQPPSSPTKRFLLSVV